ncbi:MAG: MFS transporter [Steroidobacteraceae bacterium]
MTNRPQLLTVVAVVVLNAVGIFSFGIEPVMASQLHQRLGLPSPAVALLLAAELSGSMLAAIPAAMWSRRAPARVVALLAATLFIIANAVSAYYQTYQLLLFARGLAGLAGGTLAVLTLMIAAQAPQPARIYALWVLAQTLLAVPGLMLFTSLSARFGLGTLYAVMAAAMVATLPLAWVLDPIRPVVADGTRAVRATRASARRIGDAAAPLLILFMIYALANGLWAFAAERGNQLHLSADGVDASLSAAYLISLGGAGLASWIGAPHRCRKLALIGHIALSLAALLFALDGGFAVFATFTIVLQLAWAFTAPLLLAIAARLEPAGWAMAPANFLLTAGLAVGPMVTGFLIDAQHGPRTIALLSAAVLACSLALLTTVRDLATRDRCDPGTA